MDHPDPLPVPTGLGAARLCALALAVAGLAAALAPEGQAADFASTRPTLRVDYWQRRQDEITASLADAKALESVHVVFLGDSITDFWHLDDNPWFVGRKCGRSVWDESFAGNPARNRAINLGLSGDRLENVLFRLLPKASGGLGELDSPSLNPGFIVLMVGINNTFAGEDPVAESVYAGVVAVLEAVHARKPGAIIVLESMLPTNDEAKNALVVRPVNRRLAALVATGPHAAYARWLDLYPLYTDPSGRQVDALFNDGLHPTREGYRVWRDALVPLLDALRASR